MRYRTLGDSGLVVSEVGLGANNFGRTCDREATREVVNAALECGINLIDTADIYGNRGDSERFLGEVLKGRRDEVVLATKFGMNMQGANGPDWGARGSRRYIRRAVEASLERLQTDYIDLYQYHEPDGITPVEETLEALNELVAEGKVRYVGSSNFAAWQVADADWTARSRGLTRFVSAQNHYNLLHRSAEVELLPACERFRIGVLPYFPLANGLLTGKYRRGQPAPEGTRLARQPERLQNAAFDAIEGFERFARERGITLLHVAFGGLLARRAVSSVIAGATKPEQVQANAAAGEWAPSEEDVAALGAITSPESLV